MARETRDCSVAKLEDLEPGNYFPMWLGDERLRQNALSGLVASWGMRRPFYVRQNGILAVMCGRARDVREVYVDSERFTVVAPKRPGYELFDMFGGLESVLQMDGERHARVRRLMNPSFTPQAVEALKGDIHRIIDEELDHVAAIGPEFDAMTDFADKLIPRIVLEGNFGLSPEHIAVFQRMLGEMHKLPGYDAAEGLPPSFMETIGAVSEAITDIIRIRRATPGPDMLSSLISAHDAGDKLTDLELFGQINSIATAGIGTTSSTLAGALMLFSRNPDQKAALLAEPALIDNAVEECLRHHGPGILSFVRFASRDTEVGGTRILKDMPVYVSPQAAGFDPDEYDDPFRFDIRRKMKPTLVFGSGPHHCIGRRLGRYILQTALWRMIERFPEFHLVDPGFQPTYRGLTGELSAISIPMRTH